ncbi:hypothetical protein Psuf_003330 [Phytohabitans suffuscus]|uniref:Uncharacterized protein n=1 Tax=Phytohabitans suffuscus TaxID=624315 RepID=A0A6F8YAD6_9ACTN|nr:hypothetical protein Psuf_003330 [Phytohabitans suffuscus]
MYLTNGRLVQKYLRQGTWTEYNLGASAGPSARCGGWGSVSVDRGMDPPLWGQFHTTICRREPRG